MALRRVRCQPEVPARVNNNVLEYYGAGPYFNIQLEYSGENGWDNYLFIGIEQVAELHKSMGAILAKHAHA